MGAVAKRRTGTPGDIQDAWRVMAAGAPRVAEVLVEIAEDASAPAGARVAASTAILDRVGLGAKQDIRIQAVPSEFDENLTLETGGITPADMVRKRLMELAVVSQERAREEDEIIDAVLDEEG
jgi:hypothetical protein